VIVAMGAFGVDLGSFYYQKRKLQTATDLAAISAASNIANANAAALAALQSNSYDSQTLRKVELGTYVADPAKAPSARFTPGDANANAVRLSLKTTTPMMFGRIFSQGASGNVELTSQAVAASTGYASFAIGSRLLQVDAGLLNNLLGALLGGHLSLSVMDYNSLLSTQIDLFTFANALATHAQITAVTYSNLLSGNVKVGDLLNATLDATRSSANANAININAVQAIANALASPSATLNIGSLISFGPLGNLPVGSPAPIAEKVSVLDLLSAVAQVSNGGHQVAFDLSVALPGIASVSVKLAIGEMPVNSAFVTVGYQGASVHTAQTRLLLKLSLLGAPGGSLVYLPIYVEVAAGTATLSNISCGRPDISATTVTLATSASPAPSAATRRPITGADFGRERSDTRRCRRRSNAE